jgi:hypothetical protein
MVPSHKNLSVVSGTEKTSPGVPLGAPHTRIARPKSFAKKGRLHACVSDFLKKSDLSRSDGSTPAYPSVSGARSADPVGA